MFFDLRQIKHISNLLDDISLKELCAYAFNAPKKQATVGKIVNGNYTTEYNEWCTADFIDYSAFNVSIDFLTTKIVTEIENLYKVKVASAPEVHFLSYKSGAYYKSHIDGQYVENGIAKRGVDRDITAVFYLNDGYSGGEITFDFFNLTLKPKPNDLLIYPTTFQYQHSVNTVKGIRYAIVFWFTTDPYINIDIKIPKHILKDGGPTRT